MSVLVLCKFTPLGFETLFYDSHPLRFVRVNLPRWGLKPSPPIPSTSLARRVNLPRWGLKLYLLDVDTRRTRCKFTPLGFETSKKYYHHLGQNPCKFTPLGFETSNMIYRLEV